MVKEDPLAIYRLRTEQFQAALQKKNRLLGYIAILRLAAAFLVFYFLVLGIRNDLTVFYIFSGLMVVMFFLFVVYHKSQADRRNLIRALLDLNLREQDCQEHRYEKNDPGSAYIDVHHQWSNDLDIFGEGSLFQYLNRTFTPPGRDRLAHLLRSMPGGIEELAERQEITRELSGKLEFRQLFTAHASLVDTEKERVEDLLKWSEEEMYIARHRWLFPVAIAISLVSCALIVGLFYKPDMYIYLLAVALFNWGLLSPFLHRTNKFQNQVSGKHNFLKTYAVLLDLLQQESFSGSRLIQLQEISRHGSAAVKKLSGLLSMFDQRLNMLMGTLLNSLFLFDFIVLKYIADWKAKYGAYLGEWLDATSETEAFNSLAGLAFNHPGFTYPKIESDVRGVEAVKLGHPLIPAARRIDNSMPVKEEKVVLITGANMAGKSTFLRAVGVNMVLAYAGCPVCADDFRTGFYTLFSSMRTSDSLKDEESYFLAEIKRLKMIVERMERGDQLLILLDEVLKGTNTTDKQKGSKGLIEKALKHDILCFIATHDLSLGELETAHPGRVVNYCFESYLGGDEVSFDYTIRKGIARNMNASFLMKKMGIIDQAH